MPAVREETMDVRSDEDVMRVRQVTRQWAIDLGFSLIDQTKIVTAASELARNALIYGGGGITRFEALHEGARRGLRLTFEDKGPGIPDVAQALTDGWTSGTRIGHRSSLPEMCADLPRPMARPASAAGMPGEGSVESDE